MPISSILRECAEIDYIVRGEGEETILGLIRTLKITATCNTWTGSHGGMETRSSPIVRAHRFKISTNIAWAGNY
ncbi:MAG: hypothetical protein U0V48_04420 [Anaerolineales bacterium]